MQAVSTASQWLKYWLYDWGGANLDLFLAIHSTLPVGWLWLPEVLSWVGSYWGAPAVVALLLVWRRIRGATAAPRLNVAVCRFVIGLALAMSAGALAKATFALPRPALVLGEAVYRAAAAPDSRYTMPSGHSTYVGVLVVALWPILGRSARIGLLVFAAAVGWSRIALGAHFPADVVAGLALGWACVVATGWAAERIAPMLAPAGAAP